MGPVLPRRAYEPAAATYASLSTAFPSTIGMFARTPPIAKGERRARLVQELRRDLAGPLPRRQPPGYARAPPAAPLSAVSLRGAAPVRSLPSLSEESPVDSLERSLDYVLWTSTSGPRTPVPGSPAEVGWAQRRARGASVGSSAGVFNFSALEQRPRPPPGRRTSTV